MRVREYAASNTCYEPRIDPPDEAEGCYECGKDYRDWEEAPIWWVVCNWRDTPDISEGTGTEGCDCEGWELHAETTVAAFVGALKSLGLTA